jgi:hypothetical protein
MILDFLNFIFNIQFDVKIEHQNSNFHFKNHENSFDEIYHLDVRFKNIYFK